MAETQDIKCPNCGISIDPWLMAEHQRVSHPMTPQPTPKPKRCPCQAGRYLLFAFYDYYPSGGWNDLVGQYASVCEAQQRAKECQSDNVVIIDSHTGEEVAR